MSEPLTEENELVFERVRDGKGYTQDEFDNIKSMLDKGKYDEAVRLIYIYAEDKEKSYNRKITQPSDLVDILEKYAFEDREYFVVFTLDASQKIKSEYVASIGGLDSSIVDPRVVFKKALEDNAKNIFVAHNHPSGSETFTYHDHDRTDKLQEAGNILGITLLDSLIVGYNKTDKYVFVNSQIGGLIRKRHETTKEKDTLEL